MPQIVLEITDNVEPVGDLSSLLDTVHRLVRDVAGAALANCKSRVHVVHQYRVGDGAAHRGFIHLGVRVLEGRPGHVPERLGSAMLDALVEHFTPAADRMDVQITVEVGEIPRARYFKYPAGTLPDAPGKPRT